MSAEETCRDSRSTVGWEEVRRDRSHPDEAVDPESAALARISRTLTVPTGHPSRLGGRLVGQPFQITQNDRVAVFLRQARNRLVEQASRSRVVLVRLSRAAAIFRGLSFQRPPPGSI